MQRITTLPEFPARPPDAHKGTFGRVLIVAGSRGMSGAACLSGLGALRGGAGLVYLAVPQGILPIVASVEPSYLTIPLPEDDAGRISFESHSQLLEKLTGQSSLAFGPGWGRSKDLQELATRLYREVEFPTVIDADGLNVLANSADSLSEHAGSRVLTPHPGEFARLVDRSTDEIRANREELAAEFAQKNNVILVLKGAGTVITDGERLAVNTTGNSGMGTGGTGDVLTGLIAALLAQGMPPFAAAQLGVHLQGLAGDLAAADLSGPGLIASDLPRYLGKAWIELESRQQR